MSKKDKEPIEKVQVENQTENEETTATADEQVAEENSLSEVDQLKEDLGKEKDKFLRLFAEFENYKKRTSKERVELFKTASKDVMVSILPVLDDFDRALVEISKTDEEDLRKGVELINNKLRETLKTKGLKQLEVASGEAFDAEFHQAITQIPAPTEEMKGKIIDVIEKGYKLGETIIRYPKVVVGQ